MGLIPRIDLFQAYNGGFPIWLSEFLEVHDNRLDLRPLLTSIAGSRTKHIKMAYLYWAGPKV
jgi:hypothetical protein